MSSGNRIPLKTALAFSDALTSLEVIIRLRQSLHDVLRVMQASAQEPPA